MSSSWSAGVCSRCRPVASVAGAVYDQQLPIKPMPVAPASTVSSVSVASTAHSQSPRLDHNQHSSTPPLRSTMQFFYPFTAAADLATRIAQSGATAVRDAALSRANTMLHSFDILADVDAVVADAQADRFPPPTTADDGDWVHVADEVLYEEDGDDIDAVLVAPAADTDTEWVLVAATVSAVRSVRAAASAVIAIGATCTNDEQDRTEAAEAAPVPMMQPLLDLIIAIDATVQCALTVCHTVQEAVREFRTSYSPRAAFAALTISTSGWQYRPSPTASAALQVAAMAHWIQTRQGASIALTASVHRVLG